MMDIVASTRSYERWLERQIDIVPDDLDPKHKRMREDAYAEALADGGRPFVLATRHERLARLVADALHDPDGWWKELLEPEVEDDVPAAALEALEPLLPSQGWSTRCAPASRA